MAVTGPVKFAVPSLPTERLRGQQASRWLFSGLTGLVSLALLCGADPPDRPPQSIPPASPRPMASPAPVAPVAEMDAPLRLIAQARQSYAGVKDYTCMMLKKERMGGKMPPDNVVAMKVRAEPFSVYLRWNEPRALAGQEACYVAGRNGGMMRVHSTGLLGAVGFVSLDPNDPRARQTSRHSITEAGIGNLIERYGKRWEEERRLNGTRVAVGDYKYDNRLCTRVETVHPANPEGKYLFYRSVLYFDKETHLPIRVECYDWPRRQDDPGELVELYAYFNLRLNVGLTEDVFNH